jgi:hypothetical protein
VANERRSRYERVLEGCPRLLDRLKSAAEADPYDLQGEVQVIRALTEDALGALAGTEARGEAPSSIDLKNVRSLLKQVQGIVKDAADIEAKRRDQRLSAAHVLGLLAGLRDDLCRHLRQAYGEEAAQIVDARFSAAPWTAHLDQETVKAALQAPATYDVAFRTIERDGDDVKEKPQLVSFSDREAVNEALNNDELGNDILAAEVPDDGRDGTAD